MADGGEILPPRTLNEAIEDLSAAQEDALEGAGQAAADRIDNVIEFLEESRPIDRKRKELVTDGGRDVRIDHGGISTILGLEIDGIQLVANLPDHLNSVTVRRALLEGADRLAEAAIADPSINATDDVRDGAHVDETPEEPTAIADGGERFVACPESVLERLSELARQRLRTIDDHSESDPLDHKKVQKAEAILEADARIAYSVLDPAPSLDDDNEWKKRLFEPRDWEDAPDAEAVVQELSNGEDEPINQAGDGIQEEP